MTTQESFLLQTASYKTANTALSVIQEKLQDDTGGNRHQHIVATGLHPLITTRRCIQMVATPVIDHILPVAIFRRQTLSTVKFMVRSGATFALVTAISLPEIPVIPTI